MVSEKKTFSSAVQNEWPWMKGQRSASPLVLILNKCRIRFNLSETTGLFEDDGQSRLFSLLSIAVKLPIIRISIIRKNQFFEVIRRS